MTGYARLPFGVLVSRTIVGAVEPADVTVAAADLLAAVDPGQGRPAEVPLPASRDVEWRAPLPPLSGWQRLDEVPADVVRSLVRAGADTLRALPADAAAAAGESLLDHEALTVSSADLTVTVPLRTLTALARMGFLGPQVGTGGGTAAGPVGNSAPAGGTGGEALADPADGPVPAGGTSADLVVVSAVGGWVRLAAAYGSAYHHRLAGLGLSPR